jgi:hypothetical protein
MTHSIDRLNNLTDKQWGLLSTLLATGIQNYCEGDGTAKERDAMALYKAVTGHDFYGDDE